jgi:hypothetical protein
LKPNDSISYESDKTTTATLKPGLIASNKSKTFTLSAPISTNYNTATATNSNLVENATPYQENYPRQAQNPGWWQSSYQPTGNMNSAFEPPTPNKW